MKLSSALVVGLLTTVAVVGPGCSKINEILAIEPTPDLEHPKSVEVEGVALEIPGNWSTDEERQVIDETTVTTLNAESSGSGLLMVQVYRPALELTAAGMMDTVLEALPGSLEDTAVGGLASIKSRGQRDVTRTMAGEPRQGRAARYSIKLLGEVVPHTMEVFTLHDDQRTVAVYFQWAKEDAAKTMPAFDHAAKTLTFKPLP